MKRLRDEDIPYTVVGGLSLFATDEIRDLEQGLRAVADPHDDVALARMMTAGPWRLDPLEVLHVTRIARFDTEKHLVDVIHRLVEVGDDDATPTEAATKAKLRRLLDTIEELHPATTRQGPHTILERYLELTGQVLDLLGAGTTDAHRAVANIGSFLRFAADWQTAHPKGTLLGFVDYLDAYQAAGGELPTSVELSEDVQGVRLMTLYQAKGLEFPHVFIPQLLDGEWPTREGWSGYFPPELLREPIEGEDLHTEEERRLLYVAMTRAQESLVLTTYGGLAAREKACSLFVNEILSGDHPEVDLVDRANQWVLAEPPEDAPKGPMRWRWRAASCPCPPSASACWTSACARRSWWGSSRAPIPPTPNPPMPGPPSPPSSPGWPSARPWRPMRPAPAAWIRSPCASWPATARPARTCWTCCRCRAASATRRSRPTRPAPCSTPSATSTASRSHRRRPAR